MKTCAAIACRAYSSRLFAKPLQLVGDRPILAHLLDQLKMAKKLDEIVLAISEGPDAALFVDFAEQNGYKYHVGDAWDVQQRILDAVATVDADVIIRNTSENPFLLWDNIDTVIEAHIAHGNDITVTEKLPIASFVEVFNVEALQRAHDRGDRRTCSELVSLYFAEHIDEFKVERLPPPPGLAHPEIRFAVDDPHDLVMVRRIWDALNNGRKMIPLQEIVDYWHANPDIQEVLHSKNTLFIWA